MFTGGKHAAHITPEAAQERRRAIQKRREEIKMENNYKSPEQLLRELLEARGYTTTPADGWTPYTAISADGVTIWAAWGIDPDDPARADLLFFGSDARADGWHCNFPTDNPAEEEYYILEALAGALDEECRFNALCTKEAV